MKFRMNCLAIVAVSLMMVWLSGCTVQAPEKPTGTEDTGQDNARTTEKMDPGHMDAGDTETMTAGHVDAKANEKTDPVAFDVNTAVLANFFDKFTVCLSDVPDDTVRDSGQFPPAEDDGSHYHRIVLRFAEVPSGPGTYPLSGLTYSVRDPDMHFNFGWSDESLTGTVTLDSMSGTLPEIPGGVRSRPEQISGAFEAANTYGGVFSGTFTASGITDSPA